MYSQDGILHLVGQVQLVPYYGAPQTFAVDESGNITKVGSITSTETISAPFVTATSSISVPSSALINTNGVWIYSPLNLSRTLTVPYGISCSTLQITNGAAEGYVATSDAYGNITLRPLSFTESDLLNSENYWTNKNIFYDELHSSAPYFHRSAGFFSSISKYGNGDLWIYTIGDALRTDGNIISSGTITAPNAIIGGVELSSSTLTKHSSFVVKLATSTDDFCFFRPKYKPVTVVAFEALVSTSAGISASWSGKLQRTDINGMNPVDVSWNNYTASSSVVFSTDTFNSNKDINTSQRLKIETLSTTGSVDSLYIDVWYKENQ